MAGVVRGRGNTEVHRILQIDGPITNRYTVSVDNLPFFVHQG
jgi:hypothetical protein